MIWVSGGSQELGATGRASESILCSLLRALQPSSHVAGLEALLQDVVFELLVKPQDEYIFLRQAGVRANPC